MKFSFVGFFLMLFITIYAQDEGKLVFDENAKDYGTLKYGEHAQCDFEITNTGKTDVTIKDVKSNSRNLEFKIEDSIVKPGQKIKLSVIYNTENEGPIRKTITVFTNAKPAVYTLNVRGRVLPKP